MEIGRDIILWGFLGAVAVLVITNADKFWTVSQSVGGIYIDALSTLSGARVGNSGTITTSGAAGLGK